MKSESDGSNREPLITRVATRLVEIKRDTNLTPFRSSRLPLEQITINENNDEYELEERDRPSIISTAFRLVPLFIKLLKGLAMKDWKTTTTAVLGGVAAIVNWLTGVTVPTEVIAFITMIAGFYFSGDAKK
jgi:hypothetical protein